MYALKEDLITAKHYDKQFKIDAVQYYHDHKELGLIGCASNLGISHQSLYRLIEKTVYIYHIADTQTEYTKLFS